MGEIEKTMERLNEVLVKAGFAKATLNYLYKDGNVWKMIPGIELQFDENGRYIEADNERYCPQKNESSKEPFTWVGLSDSNNPDMSGKVQ